MVFSLEVSKTVEGKSGLQERSEMGIGSDFLSLSPLFYLPLEKWPCLQWFCNNLKPGKEILLLFKFFCSKFHNFPS